MYVNLDQFDPDSSLFISDMVLEPCWWKFEWVKKEKKS